MGGKEWKEGEERGDIDMVVFTTGGPPCVYIRFFFVFIRSQPVTLG